MQNSWYTMKPGKAWELIKEITRSLINWLLLLHLIIYLSAGKNSPQWEGRRNFIVIWGSISAYVKDNAVLCLPLTFSLKQAELYPSSLKYFLFWRLSPNYFCPFCNCSRLGSCEDLWGNCAEKDFVVWINLFCD